MAVGPLADHGCAVGGGTGYGGTGYAHCLLVLHIAHYSLLTTHYSLLTALYSPLSTHYFLLATRFQVLAALASESPPFVLLHKQLAESVRSLRPHSPTYSHFLYLHLP